MMRYELQDCPLILVVYCRYVNDNNSDLSRFTAFISETTWGLDY